MRHLQYLSVWVICLSMVLTMLAGCKRNPTVIDPDFGGNAGVGGMGGSGSANGGGTDTEGLPGIPPESLGPWVSGSQYGLETVYFDFDSSTLRPDAVAVLEQNAQRIQAMPGRMVQIAGHCDERGTQEYNLALGERRALAVRNHLIQIGIPGNRLLTISYGKELPAVPGTDESAWAQNRRAEFQVSK